MTIRIANNQFSSPLNVHQQTQARMITMSHKILLVEYHPAVAYMAYHKQVSSIPKALKI